MSEQHNSTTTLEERQKQVATWIAGIFIGLSLAFLIYSIYIVIVDQQGRFDLSDAVLMPLTVVMLGVSLVSFWLIRKGRLTLGTGLLFVILVLVPPIVAVLVLQDFGMTSVSYIALMASIMIGLVLPRSSRRPAIIATVVAILITILIEVLDPAFRTATAIGGVANTITILAVLSLLGLFVRRAWGGNIRLKLVTSFTIVALISTGIVSTVVYISYRNQVREDIRQRLLNIATITAKRLDGDLHATLQTPEDMQTEAYRQMMAEGDEIIATDPDLIFSYTMRKNEQGQIYFVIDSRRADDTERDALGTIYDEPSETLQAFFNAPDRPIVEKEIYTDKYGSVLSAFAPFYRADGSLEGIFGIDIAADSIIAQEQAVLRLIVGATVAALIVVTLIGLFLGNLFVGPIVNLSSVAQKITEGDLDARAKIETADEVGDLAKVFNTMTSQLQDTLQGLEQRVTERTRNLELAGEVGRTVSQVRALDVMLKDAAELIRKQFDLYYVQVYLTDPSQTNLILQSGTGAVGAELIRRAHRLPLNTGSINGRAAIEKHSVVISNTTESSNFKPNPLLPDTRSEMAVPLMIGDRVVGVLDMQSEIPGSLNQDVLSAFEALAGQLAIAIQNANFLAETNQARTEVEAQSRRLSRANWADYLDAIHQPEETGFVFEQNKITPLTETRAASDNALTAPISVTGETLGNLIVEMEGGSPIARTEELVNAVAQQVAQQIESLRLLDSAERYRAEAEQASRRITREGWQAYAANADESLSYIYDLKEVRTPSENEDRQVEEPGYTQPLKVRDETVGKLVVQGLESSDSESTALVNAVAERLGAHIESLRQFDQAQSALSQTEKLSDASLRFAQAANLQELLTVTVETLGIPVINRSLMGVFNYNSAHDMEDLVIVANWWNGSGHEPSEIGRRYTLETLNALPFLMSTTPVFSNDTFDDERITGVSLQLVKSQNIRSMAVLPLYLGSQQIGVVFLESEETHSFSQSDIRLFTAMAPQIATVLENRRQFERAQKQAERESTLNVISQKIQGATTVEAVLQIAARELGHALGAPMTIAQLSMKDKN